MSTSQEDANKLIKEKYPDAKWNAEKKAWEFPEEEDPFAENASNANKNDAKPEQKQGSLKNIGAVDNIDL